MRQHDERPITAVYSGVEPIQRGLGRRTEEGLFRRAFRAGAVVAVLSFGCVWNASAAVTVFSAADSGPSVSSNANIPNSQAAETNFKTAAGVLGTITTINFETVPVNVPTFQTSLALGNGVTATLTGTFTQPTTGVTATVGDSSVGFNTTSGGSRYLEIDINSAPSPANVRIDFPQPIQAFGAYVGGIGTGSGAVDVTFFDGATQSIPIATPLGAPGGGMHYVGFTDPGASIVSVTFREVGVPPSSIDDSYSIDDISYVVNPNATAAAAPVPAISLPMLIVLALVVLTLGAVSVQRRRG
jgi:hypothetical protein